MAAELNLTVEALGFDQTMRVMRQLEPEVYKALGKEMRPIGRDLRAAAGIKSPTGAGAYSVSFTGRGLIVQARGMRKGETRGNNNDWSNPGVLAAILESAKDVRTRNPKLKKRTEHMLATLTQHYGKPGRFINAAWLEGKADYKGRIKRAMDDAERELDGRLKSAGVNL